MEEPDDLLSDFEDMQEASSQLQSQGPYNCSPYNSPAYAAVAGVSAGLAFISLLFNIFVFAIIILFKKWRSFSQRLVIYLTVSALLVELGIILHRVDYRNETSDFYRRFCEFGGYLDQTSNWMLLLAITSITLYCSLLLYFNKKTEKYEFVYVFFIFIFPLLYTWIPFIKNSYGRSGAWCWIRSQDDVCDTFLFGQWLQFSIWFVPLYVFMIILIVLYVMMVSKLYCVIRRLSINDQAAMVQIKGELLQLIAYPLIYFLLNVFPFINRTYNLTHAEPSLALWYFAAMANPTIGAWIALAFALDPATRKRLTWPEVRAAGMELCGKYTVVEEYPFDTTASGEETGKKQDTEAHPYQNYAECYKLNLSISSNKSLTL